MKLRVAKGNMFKSVTHTATFYMGCDHNCKYCWAECMGIPHVPKLVQRDFTEVLPVENAFIFLNSAHDSFAACIPDEWIKLMLDWIGLQHPSNRFLLQTKNPKRLFGWIKNLEAIKDRVVLGTTLETDNEDRAAKLSKAQSVIHRAWALAKMREFGFTTFLSLEPLVKFNPDVMIRLVRAVAPMALEIGLDNWQSRHHCKMERPSKQAYKRFRRMLDHQGWKYEEKASIAKWLGGFKETYREARQ